MRHRPVMLREVLNCISGLKDPKLIIDATFGGGGHSKAILEHFSNTHVVGIDRDPSVEKRMSQDDFKQYIRCDRLKFFKGRFSSLKADIQTAISSNGILTGADVVLFDLGYSNNQVIEKEIGLSYFRDQKLDMRLDRTDRPTAAQILNWSSTKELSRIFEEYGGLRSADRLIKCIVNRRTSCPFETSSDLNNAINVAGIKSVTEIAKIFQSLRIEVNDEKNEISSSINIALQLLNQNGIVLVIAFNQLEQNWIKDAVKFDKNVSISKVKASKEEIDDNFSARSAVMMKLRRHYPVA